MRESGLKHLHEVVHLKDDYGDDACVAFSGGVDSSLLAKIVSLRGFPLSLISVYFGDTDEDNYVKEAAELLGGDLHQKLVTLEELKKGLTYTLKTIDYDRVALLENAVGYYFIFKHALDSGFNAVYSANGIDELYCGYDVFRRRFHEMDLNRLIDELTYTAKNDKQMVDRVAKLFDVAYYCPFLEDEFIEFSLNVPLNLKIINQEDSLRKHYVREEAIRLGLPAEIAYREKNSFQYSSGLHRAIRQLARDNGYSDKEGKRLGYEGGVKAYISTLVNEKLLPENSDKNS
jgi:asparagine synthase (glutamine-hydrolysing)